MKTLLLAASLLALTGCSAVEGVFAEEPDGPSHMRLMMPTAETWPGKEPAGRIEREFLTKQGHMCRAYVDAVGERSYRCYVDGRWRRLIVHEVVPAEAPREVPRPPPLRG